MPLTLDHDRLLILLSTCWDLNPPLKGGLPGHITGSLGCLFLFFLGKIVIFLQVTYIILGSFHQRDENLLVSQGLSIQISQTEEFTGPGRSLDLLKKQKTMVGLVNWAKIQSFLSPAFLKMTKMEMKWLIWNKQMFHWNPHETLFHLNERKRISFLKYIFKFLVKLWKWKINYTALLCSCLC